MYASNNEARLAIVEEIAAILIDIEGVVGDDTLTEDERDQYAEYLMSIADQIANLLKFEVVGVDEATGTVTATVNIVTTGEQWAQMKADPSLTLADFPPVSDEELAAMEAEIARLESGE